MDKVQRLRQRLDGNDHISVEIYNELIALKIKNAAAECEVFLQGAQISKYQRHQEKALLWMSPLCNYREGIPLRGGIPLCWPWFGDLKRNPDSIQTQFDDILLEESAAHGFVRKRQWQVRSIESPSDDLTIVELDFETRAYAENYWPYATELIYRIEIGQQLTASLSVFNGDNLPFSFSSALHTYFPVHDIAKTRIRGFDGVEYVDTLQGWGIKKQTSDIVINEEVDRIYMDAPDDIVLHDGERDIHIGHSGSRSTVVWNPGPKKALRLGHFAPDAWTEMVCVETANILDDSIDLRPGQTHTLSITLV